MPYFGIPIRNGLPIGLGSVAGFGIAPFEPYSLFENGEQGAWYDPSDLSTLFTDSAGTTPVTAVEQFVGLMLDKSKGLVLGSEIVVNGSFSSGASWTPQAGWAISGGSANATATSGFLYQISAPIVSNAYFEFTFTVSNYVSGTVQPYFGASVTYGTAVSGNGTYTQRFGPGPNNNELGFKGNSFTGSIDNVSVKQVAGNHAFQTTSAKRPKLAARYNLLTYTEQFDNGVWNADGFRTAIVTASSGFDFLAEAAAAAGSIGHRVIQNIATVNNVACRFSITAKADTRRRILLYHYLRGAWFDLVSGTCGADSTYSTTVSASMTLQSDGSYRCVMDFTAAYTGVDGAQIYIGADNQTTITATRVGDGVSGIYADKADIRPASQATGLIGPTYQRVVDAATYDAAGFLPYLQFDGLSWSMGTGSIDPGAVDKAQVFAGVRKLSDAAQGAVAEFSATIASNNGTFLLAAPDGATQTYGFDSKGTTQVDAVASSLAAPRTNVVTGLADIAGDLCVIRVNGAVADTETGDQGTGNFLTYPLFIGGRNNASLFFNGWLSALIVRFGPNLSQSQIDSTESYVNQKTGAF